MSSSSSTKKQEEESSSSGDDSKGSESEESGSDQEETVQLIPAGKLARTRTKMYVPLGLVQQLLKRHGVLQDMSMDALIVATAYINEIIVEWVFASNEIRKCLEESQGTKIKSIQRQNVQLAAADDPELIAIFT